MTDVRGNVEALRFFVDELLLHAGRRGADQAEPTVAVMVVPHGGERLLVAHEPGWRAVAQAFRDLRKGQTQLPDFGRPGSAVRHLCECATARQRRRSITTAGGIVSSPRGLASAWRRTILPPTAFQSARGRVHVEPGAKRVRAFVERRRRGRHHAPAVRVGDPVLPGVLRARRRRAHRSVRADRQRHALAEPGRRAATSRSRSTATNGSTPRGSTPTRRSRSCATSSASTGTRSTRGSRRTRRSTCIPRSPYTRVDILPIVALGARRARRCGARGVDPRARPARNRTSAALVHPQGRRAHGSVRAHRQRPRTARTREQPSTGRRASVTVWRTTSPGRTVRRCRRANGSPDLISFYNERVDIVVDGERSERPKTKFS